MFKRIGQFIGKAVRDVTDGYYIGRTEGIYDEPINCNEPLHNHHDGCPACDMPK